MPTAQPGANGDTEKFAKYASSHPIIGHMLKHYAKVCMAAGIPPPEHMNENRSPEEGNHDMPMPPEVPKPMGAAPGGGMGSSPSGTNTAIPNWQGAARMQAETSPEVVRYLQHQDERIREQQAEIAELQLAERVSRYSRDIIRMQQEGLPISDEEARDLLFRAQEWQQDQWESYQKDMRHWMKDRRIATGGPVRMAASPHPSMGQNGQPQRLSKAQMDYALRYQRENPQATQSQAFEQARQSVQWAPDPERQGERPIF